MRVSEKTDKETRRAMAATYEHHREMGAEAARRCVSLEGNPFKPGYLGDDPWGGYEAWERGWTEETKRKLAAAMPRRTEGGA